MLSLVETVVTENDNSMLETEPSLQEVLETLKASAGSDGITGLAYKECWDSLMRTAMLNFCPKQKKIDFHNPNDKLRISVLNCDFKLYEGILARRFRKLGEHMLSPPQYVAGKNRSIQHAIMRARDAITAAKNLNLHCGIGDQDYISVFNSLVLSWVWFILERKEVNEVSIRRLKNLYANGITVGSGIGFWEGQCLVTTLV